MQLRYAKIENFKGVKEAQIEFLGPGETGLPPTHAILGDNGFGKTSVLQAIALTLSLATRRTFNPLYFSWNGFLPERLSTLGPTRVELGVIFDDEEIEATRQAYEWWKSIQLSQSAENRRLVEPGDSKEVRIEFKQGHVDCLDNPNGRYQFLGRYYVKQLLRIQPEARDLFAKIGDVFWYDQYRNLGDLIPDEKENGREAGSGHENWSAGIERLRQYLLGWWAYHTSPSKKSGKDYIPDLRRNFNRIFPETHFNGVAPMHNLTGAGSNDFYFLFERDGKVFDLAEMSSGEQSVFPLVYDFARLDIKKSIVLIDELELHLHPPEQQTLLTSLPRLGPDCQFIISTHSSFVEGALIARQTTRLLGGRLCL